MKIPRSLVLAVFAACGFPGAEKWTADKLAQRLSKFHTLPDTELADPKLEKARKALRSAAEQGTGIELKDDAPAAKAEVTDETPPTTDTPAAPAKKPGGGVKVTKAAKPAKEPKAEKPAKATKEPKEPKKGRPHYCGLVLKKHGLDKGITDKMVAEVDKLSGRPNETESRHWLKFASYVIMGYQSA